MNVELTKEEIINIIRWMNNEGDYGWEDYLLEKKLMALLPDEDVTKLKEENGID